MGLVQIGGEIRSQPLNDNFAYLDGKLLFGPESNRPNPGVANRIYVTIDTGIIYADTGAEWKQVGGISQIDWANIIGKPSTFPPTTHASQHASGGSDPITPGMIGAETPAGAQAKANQAEVNAKAASVSKSGDTMTGTLTIDATSADARLRAKASSSVAGQGGIQLDQNATYHFHIYPTGTGLANGNLNIEYKDGTGAMVGSPNLKFQGNNVWHAGNAGPFYRGAGSPEGVVTAPPGSIYQNTNGGQGTTVYYKASGTGNTGWRAIA